MKENIALIGFMGTGKTFIGKLLATRLKKNFIKIDSLIEERAQKSIPEIFKQGESIFRKFENEVCKSLLLKKKSVISTGGGIILNEKNIEVLQQISDIILLQASAETILSRIIAEGKEKRPILNKFNPLNEIKKLLQIRKPLYEKATRLQIKTDQKTGNRIVSEIIEILGG